MSKASHPSVELFRERINALKETILSLDSKLKKLAIWRFLIFLLFVLLAVFIIDSGLYAVLLIYVPSAILAFGFVVKQFNRVEYLKKHHENLICVNYQDIDILDHDLVDFYGGERFIENNHRYIQDLDIFGKHSIFKLINRATTELGESTLAKWLKQPSHLMEILERQVAVRELSSELDWRQDFQSSGMHYSNTNKSFRGLLKWMLKPNQLLDSKVNYLLLVGSMGVISIAALVYFLINLMEFLRGIADFNPYTLLFVFVVVIVNGRIIKRHENVTEEIIESSQNNVQILGGYKLLLKLIESSDFESNLLKNVKSVINNGNAASSEISKLKGYMELFQQRGTRNSIGKNYMYHLLNSFFLFDIYFILAIEQWREKNGKHLENWVNAIGKFEVLSGIASFSFLNPDFSFPSFSGEQYCISMKKVCHPLVSFEKRISNDFELQGQGKIAVITGSNMAGKSTFLRTIGVNLVLAHMGAPCAAKSATVSFLTVFTSMRVQDDISEGASSFYAELLKIEQLLTLLESGDQVFFLLDEIFKGTNSKDRYRGGVSLIKQLSGMNSFGIIATHDLELAKLAEKNMHTLNYSFNSKMADKEMLFDYKITEGICHDFNASELMRRSGIILLPETDL